MERPFTTAASTPWPSLDARLTAHEIRGATQEFARLAAGLGLAAVYGFVWPRVEVLGTSSDGPLFYLDAPLPMEEHTLGQARPDRG
jgi:hypothetical protein